LAPDLRDWDGNIAHPTLGHNLIALHETNFVRNWSEYIYFYLHFIDDVFGALLMDSDPTKNEEM
jgi:hypothetical protein